MSTAKTYDAFLDNLSHHLRPNNQYRIEVEITEGNTVATGELYNCERRIRVYEEKNGLEQLVISGIKFDSEAERKENMQESRNEFYTQLQTYLSNKSKSFGAKTPVLTIKGNTFTIKGQIYHGRILSRTDAADFFRKLAENL